MSRIGVDIGGTHTRVGLVSEEGKLLHRRSVPTRPERGPQALIDDITGLIDQLINPLSEDPLNSEPITAQATLRSNPRRTRLSIGIGVTGPVDTRTGIVNNPYTLTGWPPTDLISPWRVHFPDAVVAIDNDANTAALGEWRLGVGRGVKRFAMITLGTGIGAGFLIDGHIQRSSSGLHGEAGHQVLNPSGPSCYCGGRGCWEVLASGTAFTQRLQRLGITVDDPGAVSILDEIGSWIGLGLVNLCALFTPDLVAIGGGMVEHFSVMHKTIVSRLRAHRIMVPTDIPVVRAVTGDDAGLIGAAVLTQCHTGGHDDTQGTIRLR